MDRVETNKRPAAAGDFRQHGAQIAKIADPPVFLRTQGIQLHAGAPQLFPLFQRLRLIAAGRSDDGPAVPALPLLGERQGVIPLRQSGRQRQRLAAAGFTLILLTVLSGQDPLILTASCHRQRHFFAVSENFHVRQRVNRHFRGGGRAMHRIQQALFGDSRDRLRLAVRVDIAGADARRQRGIIEAFTLHRPSFSVSPARYVADNRGSSGRS